ncbi:AraC family transcriptional regulator [Aquabacterium sp.]|uniref:helix-turn-helix transcriptional regulator n=1 Tax=Aquabacterium sp. TaxID=1872578 RepID=UPI001984DB5C|nr:AraC family transcriptional regulator [Aquabacterium sp.]MBC7701428.1 AraC family transcriptional regulator ligand-binding domain-containing protein [Aquabacterium sp.]
MTAPAPVEQPIPFVTVTNWVRAAKLCGIDIGRIFEEEGVDTRNLHPETAVIQRLTMQHVMQRCVDDTRAMGRGQHFPLVLGETFAFEYMSDIETFITTSPTLREAARSLEWIPPLLNPYMRISLAEHGQEARMAVSFDHPEASPDTTWHFTEGVFASLLKFTRMLLGGQQLFGRITLQHAPHQDHAVFEAFFHVPIAYSQPVSAMWFDRALLDLPLRGGFPLLHEQAAQRVVQQVAQRAEQHQQDADALDNAGNLVRQIERALAQKPRLLGLGLEALAEELHLHARTLQRRLRDVGDSHSGILARVRYRLARQWLQDPALPIEDISDRLGFSDRRSFTQAFTRWSGLTPSQYRRSPGP